jgi:hypothetical protein
MSAVRTCNRGCEQPASVDQSSSALVRPGPGALEAPRAAHTLKGAVGYFGAVETNVAAAPDRDRPLDRLTGALNSYRTKGRSVLETHP